MANGKIFTIKDNNRMRILGNSIKAILVIACISCNDSVSLTSSKTDQSNVDSVSSVTFPEKREVTVKDTTGFLSNCQNWNSGTSMGYLQGVKSDKDSLGAFSFYECYDCDNTFQIIFIHKNKRGVDNDNSVWDEFERSCSNKYENFNCFAFVYPMRDPDKQKDVHEMNIDFPVTVKAYERITDDNWRFVKKIEAKTFKELSSFQFLIIYHLN